MSASGSTSNRLWLGSCLIAYLALSGVLGIVLYQRAQNPVFVEESDGTAKPVDAPSPSPLEGRIDPNTAEWYDLTRLPRVGEGLARRIVAYREGKIQEWRSAHPDVPAGQAPPVFVRPEDLRAVKGMGPKTLEQVRPYLRMPPDAATSQGS